MIAQLRGKVLETTLDKDVLRAVIDVNGVGYEVLLAKSAEMYVSPGQAATFYISESVTAFDGATTLYGFPRREDKEFFLRIRENVDGMGPKKALEALDKINKSLPDFKRAIIDGDQTLLVSVFGFTKKTAEKLLFAFRGQASSWSVSGAPKWAEASKTREEAEALSGLVNLGYKEDEAREAVQAVRARLGEKVPTESLLTEALKVIGARIS
jgi:Holliday junction DNA helicase RuvA